MDTKEQARKLIPLLQAYVDGKTLQWRQTSREWLVTEQYPTMWSNLDDWRVKPEPREVVISPYLRIRSTDGFRVAG